MKKLIVAGSRNIPIQIALRRFLSWLNEHGYNYRDFIYITGNCSEGADQIPYVLKNLFVEDLDVADIEIHPFDADWKKYGKAAGPIRNRQMAQFGDELLLIWDGSSRGSQNMKKEMSKLKKTIHEIVVSR